MLLVSCPHWGSGMESTLYSICPQGPSAANNGNLLAYDEYIGGTASATLSQPTFSQVGPAGATTIAYDGVNRLTGISDSGGWSRQFSYDQWGNMSISAAAGGWSLNVNAPVVGTAAYNANNQRTDSGLIYDAAGNLNAMNGFSNLTFDAENRLLTENSPTPYAYAYDGEGRRVLKSGAGNTTVYVYDASGELAAEYNSVAPTTAPPCATCYLTTDQLGSVRLVTDASQHVISRHDYLPFGEEVPQTYAGRTAALLFGGTDAVNQKFTGKERDAESGLDYFGARYYGSALGRFTSPDWSARPEAVPYADLNNPQSLNQYSYVGNNPLAHADPDGQCGLIDGVPCSFSQWTSSLPDRLVGGLKFEANAVMEMVPFGDHIPRFQPSNDEQADAMKVGEGVKPAFQQSLAMVIPGPKGSLAERAQEIQGTLGVGTQGRVTTAVGEAVNPDGSTTRLVGTSEGTLRPAQRAALQPGEVAVQGQRGTHAEINVLNSTKQNGQTLTSVAPQPPSVRGLCRRNEAKQRKGDKSPIMVNIGKTEFNKNLPFIEWLVQLPDLLTDFVRWKRILFLVSCCERQFGNYFRFNQETGWGNPKALCDGLKGLWHYSNDVGIVNLEKLRSAIEAVTPNTEDFTSIYTSAALDAATALLESLDYCLDNEIDHCVQVACLCRDSVYMFVQLHEKYNYSDADEVRIYAHPLVAKELRAQQSDIERIRLLPDCPSSLIPLRGKSCDPDNGTLSASAI